MTTSLRPSAAPGFYMPQLDALRAFAVGAVLVHHLFPMTHQVMGGFSGLFGVKLFFVLSGFLITRLLLQAKSSSTEPWRAAGNFYIRRALRIFPLYYFVIALALLLGIPPVREEFWWLVTYSFNFRVAVLGTWPENISHFWSLAVEEQFYLVWPWIILLVPRRALVPAAIAMIVLGPLYRLLAVIWGFNGVAFYAVTFSSLDALGSGALLAILSDSGETARLRQACSRYLLPIGLVLMATSQVLGGASAAARMLYAVFDLGIALMCTWLVAGAGFGVAGLAGRLLNLSPLRYLGRIAYGIYVYHLLLPGPILALGVWLGLDWQTFGLLQGAATAVATIIVASLSWHLMERHINALKDRFALTPRTPHEEAQIPVHIFAQRAANSPVVNI